MSGSWRDSILREFTPNVARLTLVADSDGLLLEEGIQATIRERGFELLSYEDPVAFRYLLESRYRPRWERCEPVEVVVTAPWSADKQNLWPSDLLHEGRTLSLTLGAIFPALNVLVLSALSRSDFDALYEAVQQQPLQPMGEKATLDFILRNVFEFAPELVREPNDLLRLLLRRHHQGRRLPTILDARIIETLRKRPVFTDWPLDRIIPDATMFFTFLQERWRYFVDRHTHHAVSCLRESEPTPGLTISGPVDLPFEHPDVRIYMDNLFLEGYLEPVPHHQPDQLSETWMTVGLRMDPQAERRRRLQHFADSLPKDYPAENARHMDWVAFARTWAEYSALIHDPDAPPTELELAVYHQYQTQLDRLFTQWLLKRYSGLMTLPPDPPVMIHHVPRFLARQITGQSEQKVALLVVDGLSLDQWVTVRETIGQTGHGYRWREHGVFAWIPTLTAVSRQALFAGKYPAFFPHSLFETRREANIWLQFWLDERLVQHQLTLCKPFKLAERTRLAEMLEDPRLRVVGLVIDTVDQMMHGMVMGAAGMHNLVRQWAKSSDLTVIFDLILRAGFRLFLTSDHGNIEAMGCGRPSEGAIADTRGERVRIYSDVRLRQMIHQQYPDALAWPPVGLPENCLALVAPPRQAFVQKGDRVVSHGGISLEEVIVPFIEIEPGGA